MEGNYNKVSFELRKGEILGITGLLGSGRTELALSLFGLLKPDSGEILLQGKKVKISSPIIAQKLHIGYVPEGSFDRRAVFAAAHSRQHHALVFKAPVQQTGAHQTKRYSR